MANLKTLLLIALTLSCSGGEDENAFTCAQSDRSGTYLGQFDERDGNCGPIPDQLGRLDDPTALPDTCALDAPDRWSDGDCKLERAYTCEAPGVEPGATSSAVAVTTQQDAAGRVLSGTMTLTVNDGSGAWLCTSTYDFTATRQ